MKSFNKDNLKELKKDLNKAIAGVLEVNGLSHTIGGISFGAKDFKCKLTVSISGADDAAQREFEKNVYKISPLTAEDFGKEVNFRGEMFIISGIMPKARKDRIIVTAKNGKQYRFDARTVAIELGHNV